MKNCVSLGLKRKIEQGSLKESVGNNSKSEGDVTLNKTKKRRPLLFSSYKIAENNNSSNVSTESRRSKGISSRKNASKRCGNSEISVVFNDDNFVHGEGKSDFDHFCDFEQTDCFGDISEILPDDRNSPKLAQNCSRVGSEENLFSMDISALINGENDSSEENNSDETDSTSKYELYEVDSEYLIILEYSNSLKIHGYCNIRVLFGKLNVFGHTIKPESPPVPIYSPKGSSLLKLQNKSNYSDEYVMFKKIIPGFPSQKNLKIRKDSCVILLSKNEEFNFNIIEEHISQWILPKKCENFPICEIQPKGSWNQIEIPKEWDEVIINLTSKSRVLICGGKSVGKSTFLRYAINNLLKKYESVRIIDLDPGQSEFTVPGSISIISVNEPLLGVNYTHLQETERSILSEINVSSDPQKFIECVQQLFHEKQQVPSNIPTLINFMGFTNDIAFHLLSSSVSISKPNRMIYIKSTNAKKNFKIELTQKNLNEHSKLLGTPNVEALDIVEVPSGNDDNSGWSLEPRQMREMCILSYFGANFKVNTLQDYKLPMFEFDLKHLKIVDKNNCEVPEEVINANIVALCVLINEINELFQCYGWGIVRTIDASTKKAVLITPLNEMCLGKVTHLVAGCATLPPAVYMNYDNVSGKIPYATDGKLIDFAKFSKRTHIPPSSKNKK